MSILSSVTGNVGGDPQQRQAGNGTVVSFSVATKTGREETVWVRCSAWDRVGERVQKVLRRGSRVVVFGTLKPREYERDGKTVTSLDLQVLDFEPLFDKPRRDDDPAADF